MSATISLRSGRSLSFRSAVSSRIEKMPANESKPFCANERLVVESKKGYKLKTNKAAAKRFRITGSGKVMRRNPMKQHLLEKKSASKKKQLSNAVVVSDSDINNIIGLLPLAKITQ